MSFRNEGGLEKNLYELPAGIFPSCQTLITGTINRHKTVFKASGEASSQRF